MSKLSFKQDYKDFIHFILHPSFGPRVHSLNRYGYGWWSDFKVHTPFSLIFKWLIFLWLVNLFALAPIALVAASAMGVSSRLKPDIPHLFLLAVVWAPIIEELLFRFCLRRPKLVLLYVPLLIYVVNSGIDKWSVGILVLLSFLLIFFDLNGQTGLKNALPLQYRRYLRKVFPFIFHASVLAFAFVHLGNYLLQGKISFLMILLVAPQWLTGLVLAYFRVRDSFASSVVLHSLFNLGPMLIILILTQLVPPDLLD